MCGKKSQGQSLLFYPKVHLVVQHQTAKHHRIKASGCALVQMKDFELRAQNIG